ncbi:MAG: amidohydrolase family protein [Solirubrobacterales bacterium]
MTVIDVHTHCIPRFAVDEAKDGNGAFGMSSEGSREEGEFLTYAQGFRHPIDPELYDAEYKLSKMDEANIDVAVLSTIPTFVFYDEDAGEAIEFARRVNDSLAEMIDGHDRLLGFAHIPLQAPEEAAAELRRACNELGFKGAQIGCDAGAGRGLDLEELDPVYEAAAELDLPLVLHPVYVGLKPGLEDYYLVNSIGNPLETMIGAARIMHGGVIERHPELKVVLVHGGGFLPYQVGRLDHSWEVREEPKVNIDKRPSEYLDRFWMDTITHSPAQLDFLQSLIGTDRIVLGTDIPFDMGDPAPLDLIRKTGVDPDEIGKTAADLIKLG